MLQRLLDGEAAARSLRPMAFAADPMRFNEIKFAHARAVAEAACEVRSPDDVVRLIEFVVRLGNQYNVDEADLARPIVAVRDRLSQDHRRRLQAAIAVASRTNCLGTLAPALRVALDPVAARDYVPDHMPAFTQLDPRDTRLSGRRLALPAWRTALHYLPAAMKRALLPAVHDRLAAIEAQIHRLPAQAEESAGEPDRFALWRLQAQAVDMQVLVEELSAR